MSLLYVDPVTDGIVAVFRRIQWAPYCLERDELPVANMRDTAVRVSTAVLVRCLLTSAPAQASGSGALPAGDTTINKAMWKQGLL